MGTIWFLQAGPQLLLMFDKLLYGKNAVGYFCTSLLLHFISVFSVYLLVGAIDNYVLGKVESIRPLLTTLFFLFYPFHAEPIMWVIGRVAIIAAIFTFLSIYFYLKAEDNYKFFFLSWFSFLIALLTYESIWNVVALFLVISTYRIVKKRITLKKELLFVGFMFTSFIAYIMLRKYLLGTVTGDGYTVIQENLSKVQLLIANEVKLTGRNFTPPFANSILWVAFFSISVLFYSWCIYKLSFKKELVYLSIVLWVAVVSGVVTATPLGIDTHYNESERYVYYSSFFYCFFITIVVSYLLSIRNQLWMGFGVCLTFFILFLNLQKNYSESSAVTKSTVDVFKMNPSYKRVLMIDVPAKHYGVPVLRISPQSLINWMVPSATYDTVIVLSQSLNKALSKPYPLKNANWQELANEKKWNRDDYMVQDSVGKKIQLSATDLLLWYKTDGLYKIDVPIQLPQRRE